MRRTRERETRKIKEYFHALVAKMINPDGEYPAAYIEVVQARMYRLMNIQDDYNNKLMKHIDVFRASGRAAKANSINVLQKAMDPAFVEAKAISGRAGRQAG
jgi:hypothetical protein